MRKSKTLEEIRKLAESDDYKAALLRINEERAAGNTEAVLSLYEAICYYEAGDDVETLRLIDEFLASDKCKEKHPYALFTAAVSLENLGLYEQALELLDRLPKSYPDLKKERSQNMKEVKRQRKAMKIFSAIVDRWHEGA